MHIDQRFSGFSVDDYIVAGPSLTKSPTFGAGAKTSVVLTPGSIAEELDAQLDIDIGAQYRFLGDPTKLVARDDLGAGTWLWMSSSGGNGFYWYTATDHLPYVDPAYDFPARRMAVPGDAQPGSGDISLPAMIFDGTSWLTPLNSFQTSTAFTIGMVAVLHANHHPTSQILMESFVEGTVTDSPHNFTLSMLGNRLSLTCGIKPVGAAALKYWHQHGRNNGVEHFTHAVTSLSKRPVIIVLSSSGTTANFVVVDAQPLFKTFRHPALNAAATKFYVGRPVMEGETEHNAVMDILDLFTFNAGLNLKQLHTLVNRLDHIYRISK